MISPQKFDVVLGAQGDTFAGSLVLGGLEGVKQRLASEVEEPRLAALQEALKYGQSGLELVIQALADPSETVQRSAYLLLRNRKEPAVQKVLQTFNFYRFFDLLQTLKGGSQAALSPDGETIAFLKGKNLKGWNVKTGELLYTIPKYPYTVDSLLPGLDPQTLIRSISGDHNRIEVWRSAELEHTFYGHEAAIRALVLSPNQEILATGSDDRTIRLWNLPTGKPIWTISSSLTQGSHRGAILSLVFSPDGESLISSSTDGTLKIWNLRTRDRPRTLKSSGGAARPLAVSPNGQVLAGACWNGIYLWHLQTGQILRVLANGTSGAVRCLCFSPNGQVLASSENYDREIKLWNLQTGQGMKTLPRQTGAIECLGFRSDGQVLISSQDKTTKLWGVQ